MDFDAFAANERDELANAASHGQQLAKVLANADILIENDSTLEEFQSRVTQALAKIEKEVQAAGFKVLPKPPAGKKQ